MVQMQVRLFGAPTVILAGGVEANLSSDKARGLLAYLAVEAGQAHRREKLAGLLWPGYTESSARTNLRRALADLRQAIGDHQAMPPYLLVTQDTLQFNATSDASVDVSTFTRLTRPTVLVAPSDLPGSTLSSLEQAIALYRAPFLDGFSIPDSPEFDEWALLTREQLNRLMLDALRCLADAYRAQGEPARALPFAWRQVDMDPWQESAHRQVMQLLALSGQRAAALAQYESCRRVLAADLGIEPSEPTRQLAERIRSEEWPPAAMIAAGQPAPSLRTPGSCPYRGLAFFHQQDAPFFYGRETFVDRLACAVAQPRPAAAVVGPSGSGKSSVVFAGLLPRLSQDTRWLSATCRPGSRPFAALAAALQPLLTPGTSETDRLIETQRLANALLQAELPLSRAVERLFDLHPQAHRLLLVIDQFEELHTLCPEPAMRQRFIDALLATVQPGLDGRCTVLIVLRADFMGQALAHRPLADALQAGTLLLGPMKREEFRVAIERPAGLQGAAFEPVLVDRIRLVGITSDMLLWDVATGQVRQRFAPWAEDAFSLAISPDGTQALAGSFYDKVAVLWDLQSGARLGELSGHSEGVHGVAFSPDGRRALTGSYDDSLMLWDLASGQRLTVLNGHDSDVLDLAISPDGRTAFSSGRDGGLMQWDLVDAQEMQRLPGHADAVWDVAFSPDGSRALSASGAASPNVQVQDASLRIWDLASGRQLQVAVLPVDVIMQVALSPDGRTALAAATDGSIHIWDVATWQEVGRLEGHAGPPTAIEFTPDGQRALSAAVDGTLILWDVPSRQVIQRLDGHGEGLWSLAISPDGRRALSDSGDSSMILWDLQSGQELRSFVRHDPPADSGSSGMAFLPDGRTAISCEQDGILIEWNLETGEEIRRLGPHASLRTRIVVSPDGKLAMTSGMDGSLMLWNLENGQLVRRSSGHDVMMDLAISPDGGSVLAGSSDTTIFQWRLDDPTLSELEAWVRTNRYPGE